MKSTASQLPDECLTANVALFSSGYITLPPVMNPFQPAPPPPFPSFPEKKNNLEPTII